MLRSSRVRVSGPLMTYTEGFAAELTAQGYTDSSVTDHLRLVAHLSRWMAPRAVATEQITGYVVDQFVADRRTTHTALRSTRALEPLMQYLRSLAVVRPSEPAVAPRDELLCAYDRFLVNERCVKAGRHRVCMTLARDFLEGRDVAKLTSADVTMFVRGKVRRPGLSEVLSALRSVLRFLFLHGHTSVNLVHAVPSTSHRRLVSLPQGLDKAEVEEVLATCDRRTTTGRRNYAVMLIMVRLGLRAVEVASLTLDDIDWEAGEIVVAGKGSCGRLPLPTDVGEALVSYLQRRPRTQVEARAVFLRSRAPYRGGKSGMIIAIAQRALRAAGISSGASHRLRHTAATEMLRHGASLTEIAQVLRHRHIDTTAIYAKVDRDGLRELAQPWPTGFIIGRQQLRALVQPWPGGAA